MIRKSGSKARPARMTATSQRLDALRTRYVRSLASKRAALEEAVRAFERDGGEMTAKAVQVLVHRLAGSAPTYGYAALGALAAKVDRVLIDWCESAPATRPPSATLASQIEPSMRTLIDMLAQHAADADETPAS
jgi:HPt (histidine-containing phosphotransfer) domain-containing protein